MTGRFVNSWSRGRLLRQLLGTAGLISVLASAPVSAQSEDRQPAPGERGNAPGGCAVTAQPGEIDGVETLHADCSGRLVILGPATAYKVVPNERLNATLIDLQFEHERRMLLLSMGADGLPLLEDISGQVALAAGRGPMSDIGDVVVDPGEFARAGRISVRADERAESARGENRQIALDEQLARERAR